MNLEEFRAKYPLLLSWIQKTLAAHSTEARPISSLQFPRLPHYFTLATLDKAKVVATYIIPLPPLTSFGLGQFAEFENFPASGITYLDTVFIHAGSLKDESLHFHELVHVVQWGLLGPERFLALYAEGLESFGYRRSPLEAMAYKFSEWFEHSTEPFNVEKAVGRELAACGTKET